MDCRIQGLSKNRRKNRLEGQKLAGWRNLGDNEEKRCQLELKQDRKQLDPNVERESSLRRLLSRLRNMSPSERARILREHQDSSIYQDEEERKDSEQIPV